MKNQKQLRKEFERNAKELQSKCKHKKSEWMMSEWAPDHIDDFFVKACNLCNKTLEKDYDKEKFKMVKIGNMLKLRLKEIK